jgi:hypothetical protein
MTRRSDGWNICSHPGCRMERRRTASANMLIISQSWSFALTLAKKALDVVAAFSACSHFVSWPSWRLFDAKHGSPIFSVLKESDGALEIEQSSLANICGTTFDVPI